MLQVLLQFGKELLTFALKSNIELPSIKYVVMFGAPVSVKIHQNFLTILPNGTTYTPYGATEALPVSNISGTFILKMTAEQSRNGHGTCVGKLLIEGIK